MNRERTGRSSEAQRKNKRQDETDKKRPVRGLSSEKGTGRKTESSRKYKDRNETDKRPVRSLSSEKGAGRTTESPRKYRDRNEPEKKPVRRRSSEKSDNEPTESRRKFVRRGESEISPVTPRKYRQRIDKEDRSILGSKATEKSETGIDEIRINKYLAISGICSRREADKFIKAGLVSVNGQIITELGTKVKKSDDVRYNGERLKSEKLVYILLNKPKDYITTLRDPYAKKTVMELVQKACKERVYPVGRLDRNTTGVLLLTNDGDLAKQISHPSSNKLKIYHVTLDKSLTKGDFQKITEGFNLEDGFIKADELSYIDLDDKKEIGIEIHSGRNHIVRRVFEYLGYNVRKLDRVYFAGLTKKGLERGKYRFLTQKEIAILKMGSYQ